MPHLLVVRSTKALLFTAKEKLLYFETIFSSAFVKQAKRKMRNKCPVGGIFDKYEVRALRFSAENVSFIVASICFI